MSGGSYEYLSERIEEAAGIVVAHNKKGEEAIRAAFSALLLRVASAIHELEWYDSHDRGPDVALAKMRDLVGPAGELDAATERAKEALAVLLATLQRAAGEEPRS